MNDDERLPWVFYAATLAGMALFALIAWQRFAAGALFEGAKAAAVAVGFVLAAPLLWLLVDGLRRLVIGTGRGAVLRIGPPLAALVAGGLGLHLYALADYTPVPASERAVPAPDRAASPPAAAAPEPEPAGASPAVPAPDSAASGPRAPRPDARAARATAAPRVPAPATASAAGQTDAPAPAATPPVRAAKSQPADPPGSGAETAPGAAAPARADTVAQPKRTRVERLLAEARADLAAGRLSEPPLRNAFDRYQAVLAIEADNAAALQGVDAVVEALIARFERAFAAGDVDGALPHLRAAEKIDPGAAAVRRAREALALHYYQRGRP